MSKPQQPELHRSGRNQADPHHHGEVAAERESVPLSSKTEDSGHAPVPPENRPGHHPDVEQDKPPTPPDRWRRTRFPFAFDRPVGLSTLLFGVTPSTAYVDVDRSALSVRFGPWRLRTSLQNVDAVEVTGPYLWWKVAGPARVSLADRGITFATSRAAGVCIRFREPVPAALPLPGLRHPAITVTVAAPEALVETLAREPG